MTAVPVPPAPADYETKIREAIAWPRMSQEREAVIRSLGLLVAAEVAAERERIGARLEEARQAFHRRGLHNDESIMACAARIAREAS